MKCGVRTRTPALCARRKSRALRRRRAGENVAILLLVRLHRQAPAAFATAILENLAPTTGGISRSKPVGSYASRVVGLIGALHLPKPDGGREHFCPHPSRWSKELPA